MSKTEQRPIKFRAWSKRFNMMTDNPEANDEWISEWQPLNPVITSIQSDSDLILMQYTGLTDEQGTDIYEGDICEAFKPNSYLGGIYEVAWHQEKGRWYYKNQPDYKNLYQVGCAGNLMCRVIGNTFQNGDLHVKD